MKATITNLVHSVTKSVADRYHHAVPRKLDLHYITNRLLAMSQCANAPIPTYIDDGRTANIPISKDKRRPHWLSEQEQLLRYSKNKGNSPADVSTFLQNRHNGHALIISLSDTPLDDRSLMLLRRQVLHWNWSSPCKERSETPALNNLLELCYVLHAFLSLEGSNVVVLSCANGKTRSAIAVACYLKFSGLVNTSIEGFSTFLIRRCPQLDATRANEHIPPSLRQFFNNFDQMIDMNDVMNPKPLFLRAIALEGVPVEDKPCIDIWDADQRHVFSSEDSPSDSRWAEEEGFYRVNRIIDGEFCLLCRFGGIYASDTEYDPSKVLFRYTNSIGFLSSGTFELPKSKIDMMRRYEASFENEEFLLTLILESYWDSPNPVPGLQEESQQLPLILQGYEALEHGWQLLTRYHAAKPNEEDCLSLKGIFNEASSCPDHIVHLALQLTNLDLQGARDLLMESCMKEWWYEDSNSRSTPVKETPMKEQRHAKPLDTRKGEEKEKYIETDHPFSPQKLQNPIRPGTPEPTCQDILDILDEEDEADSLDNREIHAPMNQCFNFDFEVEDNQTKINDYLRYEPIMFPNRGDVVDAFGEYSKDLAENINFERNYSMGIFRPRMPMHKRKLATKHQVRKKYREEGPSDFEDREAALQLLERLNHTGITLDDLLQLQRNVRELMIAEEEKEEVFFQEGKEELEKEKEKEKKKKSHSEEDLTDIVNVKTKNSKITRDEKYENIEQSVVTEEKDKIVEKKDEPLKLDKKGEVTKKQAERKDERNPKEDGEPPLKSHPEFEKYFRMLKMGLPIDAVKHSMKRDNKDSSILDLDPNKSLSWQQKIEEEDDAPLLKKDPEYEKYFKMLKMGLAIDAVKHALQRDGKDPSIMDLDPEKSLKSQLKKGNGPPLKQDPEYEKYFKMLKMGLPIDAVKHALQRDGKDPNIMDLDPEKSLKSQLGGGKNDELDTGIPLKDDPEYQKYFKMLKMGLPIGAVKNALQRDGKEPSIMDLDPEKSLAFQSRGGPEEELVDTGIPLKDDPEYSKYFKMLKMGLPVGAVKNALQRDGKDPSVMDLNHDKSIAFQLAKPKGGRVRLPPKKKKKRVRRKKIYWTPIDAEKITEGSLWELVKGIVDFKKLSYDKKEFESLFTESTNPADKKKKNAEKGKSEKKKKKENVALIDGKRSMNGGIVLARLKKSYAEIADMVNLMDAGEFDSTQLKALNEFLPSDEERGAVKNYVQKGKGSPEEMDQIMSVLPECEKYMIAMLDVSNAALKFDAMLFKVVFQSRLDELSDGISIVKKACNEVQSSKRLRKMFAVILTLVNEINTGGEGNLALGFNVDALLKLSEAKAFDKKTSVLEYLVKLIRQNDKNLLHFKDDLETVPAGEGIILDGLVTDMKSLNLDLEKVTETAAAEADSLEKEGKLPLLPDKTGKSGKIQALNISDEILAESESTFSAQFESIDDNKKNEEDIEPDVTNSSTRKIVERDDKKGFDAYLTDENIFENKTKNDKMIQQTNDSERVEGDNQEVIKVDNNNGSGGAGNYLETKKARTVMEDFTMKARKSVDEVLNELENLKKSYNNVLKYFGEDEKMPSNEFFGTLKKFMSEFKDAAEKVEKSEKQKEKERKKAEKKAAAEAAKKASAEKEKAKEVDDKNIDTSESAMREEINIRDKVPNIGDIASMAAAAASKKNEIDSSVPASSIVTKKNGSGNIAPMAAAVSRREASNSHSESGKIQVGTENNDIVEQRIHTNVVEITGKKNENNHQLDQREIATSGTINKDAIAISREVVSEKEPASDEIEKEGISTGTVLVANEKKEATSKETIITGKAKSGANLYDDYKMSSELNIQKNALSTTLEKLLNSVLDDYFDGLTKEDFTPRKYFSRRNDKILNLGFEKRLLIGNQNHNNSRDNHFSKRHNDIGRRDSTIDLKIDALLDKIFQAGSLSSKPKSTIMENAKVDNLKRKSKTLKTEPDAKSAMSSSSPVSSKKEILKRDRMGKEKRDDSKSVSSRKRDSKKAGRKGIKLFQKK